MSDSENSSWQGPLQGVRVIDLTRVLAGPAASLALADRGADLVIAGGMGQRAQDLLVAQGVDVIVGGHSNTYLSNVSDRAVGPYPTMVGETAIVHASQCICGSLYLQRLCFFGHLRLFGLTALYCWKNN